MAERENPPGWQEQVAKAKEERKRKADAMRAGMAQLAANVKSLGSSTAGPSPGTPSAQASSPQTPAPGLSQTVGRMGSGTPGPAWNAGHPAVGIFNRSSGPAIPTASLPTAHPATGMDKLDNILKLVQEMAGDITAIMTIVGQEPGISKTGKFTPGGAAPMNSHASHAQGPSRASRTLSTAGQMAARLLDAARRL